MKTYSKRNKRHFLRHAYTHLAILWFIYFALAVLCGRFLSNTAQVIIAWGIVFQIVATVVIVRIVAAKRKLENRERQESYFLANMSHEIRTPLNAIIGFAELAMREDIPPAAYEHVFTIKQAGANLLSMINDILDYSKMESGKMNIVNGEYHFSPLVNDIVSIIKVKAAYSRLRFVVFIDGNIPSLLIGDEIKVRQALLNVLSNAVKYTDRGFVSLTITGQTESADNSMISLDIKVADSGKGIKKEDIEKLFNDYVQVDDVKNKGIEGTGLGLVITNNILTAMGGSISVESKYGSGSVFTLSLPQKFNNPEKHAQVLDRENKGVLIYERREINADSISRTLENLDVYCTVVTSEAELDEEAKNKRYRFIFTAPIYYETVKKIMTERELDAKLVFLTEFGDMIPDLTATMLSMPAYSATVADVLNGVSGSFNYGAKKEGYAKFIAPEAKVLLVDDANTNLRVAEGLLSPYKMQITTCKSGREAIDAVKSERYDIVFMDHMMPGMDGLEATRHIRALDDEYYRKLPIIALTANAVAGAKEMFLSEGCDDFIPKPIEISKLNMVLGKWIPEEKRKSPAEDALPEDANGEDKTIDLSIEGIDIKKGLILSGGNSVHYMRTLTVFYEDGFEKIEVIKRSLETGDLLLYATYVHGLKSASASIGADQLSEIAHELEMAGKVENIALINELTPKFLLDLESLLRAMSQVLGDLKPKGASAATAEALIHELVKYRNALDSFDSEAMDNAADALHSFESSEEFGEEIKEILQNALIGDYDEVFAGVDKLLGRLRRD
ncbi:MAG: response regulator [Chitinispirillales bacterium]|jgi:signal transduction histidine kinase/CheY-like chemotaxis protein|nr:response regulator [Chitinispirillales bacterium]